MRKFLRQYFFLMASEYEKSADFYRKFPVGTFLYARGELLQAFANLLRSLGESFGPPEGE